MWFIGAFSFPSCWVLLAIFFAFLRRFSSLGAVFVSVLVDFARFFFAFLSFSSKVCLQTCLAICSTASRLRWIRTVLLRLRVIMNPPPRLHQFPHHGPRRPLRSPSQRSVCHGHFLSFSAVAPSEVGGFSGERSAKLFPQYIWQFQCDFFRDKCAVDSYLNLDWLSLVFFNR